MKTIRIFLVLLIFISCHSVKESTVQISNFSNLELNPYSYEKLVSDFELLIKSLKEAHTGLYWYASEKQFDSLVAVQRALLKAGQNSLQFYNIVSPIVAFSKEDHCDISFSEELEKAFVEKGQFLPFILIHLGQKQLILNQPFKGFELVAVNGTAINDIYQRLFNTFGSDGFIQTSKYRYLDFRGFSREYAKVVNQEKENTITIKNPNTGKLETHRVQSVSAQGLRELQISVVQQNDIRKEIRKPAQLSFDDNNTAVLTFRTFGNKHFKKYHMNFKMFVDSSFAEITKRKPKNLVIDIRDNGGGTEGNEDYLFSYLTNRPYNKYKYVGLSQFQFGFLAYTDYADSLARKGLEEGLKSENEASEDGKLYRKAKVFIPEPLKEKPYIGDVYVLTSGWTYSGGAEFSTLMKEHTGAVFIGEETGGGYYGNTSGTSLELTLPNTKLVIDIPILKFVLDVKKGDFGRGTMPDFHIWQTFEEFISGYDTELEFTKKLIVQ